MHQKFRNYNKEAESEVFDNPTTKKLATDVTLSSFSGSMFPISLLVGGGFCGCTSRNVIHQKFGGSAREVLTDYATGTKSARPRLMGEVVGDAAAEQI